ncbi:MAG: hypothetical protein IH789_11225 [Acidobacteria bacterium]|nr:hypothetical protein [Acidobacteriota bacterium]
MGHLRVLDLSGPSGQYCAKLLGDLGADGIELDVRLTKDEKLVVFHDRCLDRTSNGAGPVNHRTLDEVRSLDAGTWFDSEFGGQRIPTLDDVFEFLPADFLINAEMKVIMKEMRFIASWLPSRCSETRSKLRAGS